MKEHPILFNAEMVRAVLDGRKTVTRRVVKPQPKHASGINPWTSLRYFPREHSELPPVAIECGPDYPDDDSDQRFCPYGSPGDRLWVRETWGYRGAVWSSRGSQEAHVTYHADGSKESVPFENPGDLQESTPKQNIKYPPNFDSLEEWERRSVEGQLLSDWWKRQQKKPSIHMPRWASRILLEVVSVRVERVQAATTASIDAEGVDNGATNKTMGYRHENMQRMAWRDLWESLYRKGGDGSYRWDLNPWVWVVEFKRVQP